MRIDLALAVIWLLASLGSGTLAAAAADEGAPVPSEPYPQMGAPNNPRVPARFNQYHDHAAATQLLKDLAAAYPDYARLESLGLSYGGREMWVLTVTDFSSGDPSFKPGMWIDGCIHANEIQATEVVLYTAWFLLETRSSNSFVERLLKERTFYLMPIMSPDARDSHFYDPNTTSDPRTGLRPVDEDRDGLIDEDGPEDFDGDGVITQMRVADPNGRLIPDKDYPQRLVEAKPDERGEYTRLGEEGYDNDGDGRVNEDGPGGYDPNRNWGDNWQPNYVQPGAHRYPFSILENRVVADFIMMHPNIAGSQSFHNSGGMILWGPGMEERPYNAADSYVLEQIAKRGAEMLPGYKPMVIWRDLYTVYGGAVDWLYSCCGALSFTNELWANEYEYFHTPPDSVAGGGGRNRTEARKFDDYLLLGQGYVDWHEIEHPQYGKIEVGGSKKSWGRQPPSFMLEEECHRNMAFTLYHADMLPLVNVQEATARALPGGLTEVTAVIANERMAPTRLGVDTLHGLTPPDMVRLEPINATAEEEPEVVASFWSADRFFERPTEQQMHPQVIELQAIPGLGALYCRWLVRGPGPFAVSVYSVKGGRARRAVEAAAP